MDFRRALALLLLALCLHKQGFSFTIINQTDAEKTLRIEEAYRPEPDMPGNIEAPLSLGYAPHNVTVPAHAMQTIQLNEPCSVVLVGVVTKRVSGKKTTTSTTTMCYEPYSYQGMKEDFVTDDWGLVIHKPMPLPKPRSFLDPDYLNQSFVERMNKERGYGIKCLHPKLLEKVSSFDELPEEVAKFGGDKSLSSRRS